MRKYGWMTPTLALTVLVGSLASAFDEKKIKTEDLPKKVMAAVKKVYPAAKIVGAVKETDDDNKDEVLYVVELKDDNTAVELAIDDDGKVQAIEKEIDADDLPKAVTRAAAKRFPNGKIGKVEEVTDSEDDVVYELEITNEGKKLEVVMAPNGKIIDIDEDGDDDKKKDDDKKDKDKKKDKKKKDKDDDNG